MRKVTAVKAIVKLYFVTALSFSFTHFIHAAEKVGLHGLGAWSMPFAVDGLAVVGMVMRSKDFDDNTNKIGLWLQMVCGSLSLAVNIFAGNTVGESIQGATWVALYVLMESVAGKIKSRKSTEDAQAIADAEATIAAASAWLTACTHPTTCTSEAQCQSKTAASVKRSKTMARKARQSKAQAAALATLVNA